MVTSNFPVNVRVTRGTLPTHGYLIQAIGFGKNLVKHVATKADAERWRGIAASRLIMDRLKGIVAQRKMAYEAKHYTAPDKVKALNDLHFYLDQLQGCAPERVYNMVLAHKSKWQLIMPQVENKMTIEMQEIIAYCHGQINATEQK